jgi:hypothetical protein
VMHLRKIVLRINVTHYIEQPKSIATCLHGAFGLNRVGASDGISSGRPKISIERYRNGHLTGGTYEF